MKVDSSDSTKPGYGSVSSNSGPKDWKAGVTVTFDHIDFIRNEDPIPEDAEGELANLIPEHIKRDRHIIRDVSGYALPGEITAIMGCSGAGKTTLLNILAGRNQEGTLTGNVLINGEPYLDDSTTVSGVSPAFVCSDEDTLYDTLTVRESIMFSARLRLPRTLSLEDVNKRTNTVMSDLGLSKLADVFIGGAGVASALGGGTASLSTGQRRLVSIGTELVAGKDLLFLDEPTSGLDASSALSLVNTLTTLCRQDNITIIMVIHQPRNKIFMLLDRLMLLSPGGHIAYFGPVKDCEHHIIESWEVKKPQDETIADFLLDITATLPASSLERIAEKERPRVLPDVEKVIAEVSERFPQHTIPDDPQVNFYMDFASWSFKVYQWQFGVRHSPQALAAAKRKNESRIPWHTQFYLCAQRAFRHRIRARTVVVSIYSVAVATAAIMMCFYWDMGVSTADFQNKCAVLTMMPFVLSLFCITVFESMKMERRVFELERNNGYYSVIAAQLSMAWVDWSVLQIMPPIICGLMSYWAMNLQDGSDHVTKFLFCMVLMNTCAAGLCRVVGGIFRDVALATSIAAGIMLINVLFSGFLVNPETIPDFFSWVDDFCWAFWGCEILFRNELDDQTYCEYFDDMNGNEQCLAYPGEGLLDYFNIHSARYSTAFTVLLLMAIGYNLLAVLIALRFHRVSR